MNYSTGYISSFYGMTVDPVTWRDMERFEIISGNIDKNIDNLRDSASLVMKDDFDVLDQWIRIYMDANQSGDVVHVPLFTGIATSPSVSYTLGVSNYTIQCYSVLKPLEDILLPKGYFASTRIAGTDILKELLKATPAPVVVDNKSGNLTTNIVAEGNETNLTMIDTILPYLTTDEVIQIGDDNIGTKTSDIQLRISGDGHIVISAVRDDPVAIFSKLQNDVVTTDFNKDRDWFECPNVLVVSTDANSETIRDDDPNSILSTVSRGREIWASEVNVTISDNESLLSYGRRKLKELQIRNEFVDYTRRFDPAIQPGDIVRIKYPDLDGDYRVESQSIDLSPGAPTSETAYRRM